MRIRPLLLFLLIVIGCWTAGRSSSAPASSFPAVVYTSAPEFRPTAWLHGGERFPAGAQLFIRENGQARLLVKGFSASADPDVSFDGKRVLFAGKRAASDPWQIWEVSTDGSDLRQITTGKLDSVRPLYLPEERFVYATKLRNEWTVVATGLNGNNPVSLFNAPGSALPTDVLRDGRILFQSAYPLGGETPEIYTVYSDGSGVESYRCDHGKERFGARQLASGDILFSTGSGLARFSSPYAQQQLVAAKPGEYAGEVAEIDAQRWLLSFREKPTAYFQLAMWSPQEKQPSMLVADHSHLLAPRVISQRPIPNRHPSGLHDWKFANLLALNVYTSKHSIPVGSAASVRVYTLGYSGERVLGTASIENDGSFFVQVPGDAPLKFELLDKKGKSVKKQDGWMWARGGEQRVCVGCHAGPEHAPENRVPAVLLRSTKPADLTGTTNQANVGGH